MLPSSSRSLVKFFGAILVVAVAFGAAAAPSEAGVGDRLKSRLGGAVNLGRGVARSGVGKAVKVAAPVVRTVLPILLKQ